MSKWQTERGPDSGLGCRKFYQQSYVFERKAERKAGHEKHSFYNKLAVLGERGQPAECKGDNRLLVLAVDNKRNKEGRKHGALRPQKTFRLIRDGEVGGSGIFYI